MISAIVKAVDMQKWVNSTVLKTLAGTYHAGNEGIGGRNSVVR